MKEKNCYTYPKEVAWFSLLDGAQVEEKPYYQWIGTFYKRLLPQYRGELLISIGNLAKQWNWEYHTVQRFLRYLKTIGYIEITNEKVTTRIKIVNFDTYDIGIGTLL